MWLLRYFALADRQDSSHSFQRQINSTWNMATSSGISALVPASLAPPVTGTDATTAPAATAPASTTATTTPTPTKTLEPLMKEIDELKSTVEKASKRLDKIELGRKKTDATRDAAIAGRTEIQGLKNRVTDLQTQVTATTRATDPTPKTFEKRQKNAHNSLKDILKKLDSADKRLEKGIGSMPTTPATTVNASAATTSTVAAPASAATTTAPVGGESDKGIGSLVRKIPDLENKKSSKETAKPVDGTTAREDDEDEEEEESEYDEDDDDVVSDKKTGERKISPYM